MIPSSPLSSATPLPSQKKQFAQRMQEAIPYSKGRTWMPLSSTTDVQNVCTSSFDGNKATDSTTNGKVDLRASVKENPVMVLGRRGCCMCHVVRRLLLGLGVNPLVMELDDDRNNDAAVIEELKGVMITSTQNSQGMMLQLPAVFIGGRHVGGLDQLMAVHISGDLVPILKDAGGLWL